MWSQKKKYDIPLYSCEAISIRASLRLLCLPLPSPSLSSPGPSCPQSLLFPREDRLLLVHFRLSSSSSLGRRRRGRNSAGLSPSPSRRLLLSTTFFRQKFLPPLLRFSFSYLLRGGGGRRRWLQPEQNEPRGGGRNRGRSAHSGGGACSFFPLLPSSLCFLEFCLATFFCCPPPIPACSKERDGLFLFSPFAWMVAEAKRKLGKGL